MTYRAEQIWILAVPHLIRFLCVDWEVELCVTVAIMVVTMRDPIQKGPLLFHQLMVGENRIGPEPQFAKDSWSWHPIDI